MKKKSVYAAVAALGVVALAGTVEGGQFKRLETSALPIGGFVQAFSSPQNHNIAMQGDVFEFVTSAQGTYTCGIVGNNTGRALTVRLISLVGSTLQTCTTPPNGICTTPAQGLGTNFLFQCTVFAPGAGSPVGPNSIYVLRVSRIAPLTDALSRSKGTPQETGVKDEASEDN